MSSATNASNDQGTSGSRDLRPDIQALRALAVALVVLYHLWPHRLPGGYVGVDVFFVVSGFLMTRHLWSSAMEDGRVRLAQFWARRARRLLPASLTVLVAAGLAVPLLAPSDAARRYLSEVLFAGLYAENWFLASRSVDYLGADDTASPVQHYWSLSVEEQFYVLLPLLVAAALWLTLRYAWRPRVVVGGALGLFAVGSLMYSVWLTDVSSAAYFSTFTRFWEFAAGGLLALSQIRALRMAWIAAVGWLAIGASALWFDGGTPFPGYAALLPVLGAVAAIAAGERSLLTSLGRWRPVAVVGGLSYAVYLWHWPLVVLVPLASGHPLRTFEKVSIIVATGLLAWLTTRFVEAPLRFGGQGTSSRRPVVVAAWSLAGMGAVVAVVAGGYVQQTWQARQQEQAAIAAEQALGPCVGAIAALSDGACGPEAAPTVYVPPLAGLADDDDNSRDCWSDPGDPSFNMCTVGDVTPQVRRVLVIGDSHSSTLIAAYMRIAESGDWAFDVAGHGACWLTTQELGETADARSSCTAWRHQALDVAAASAADRYDLVVVTHRAEAESLGAAEREVPGLVEAWGTIPESVPVLAIADNPGIGSDFVACLERVGPERGQTDCAVPRSQAVHVDSQMLAANEAGRPVSVADFTDVYCDATSCSPVIGGLVAYRPDGHHLSATFARTLAEAIEDAMTDAMS